jgi:hypothetical protein
MKSKNFHKKAAFKQKKTLFTNQFLLNLRKKLRKS